MSNCVHVILQTTSELHCAYPGNGVKVDGGLISKTLKKTIKGQSVPYFASNGLRGMFRRAIAKRIEDNLSLNQQKISKDLYLGLHCGSADAQPDTAANSIEELVRASNNAYMGLFGGGARILPSRYKVSDIMPILNFTVDHGAVQVPTPLVKDLLDSQVFTGENGAFVLKPYNIYETSRFITRVDDLTRNVNLKQIDKVVDGGVDSIQLHTDGIADNKKARADGAKKTDLSNIVSIESVNAGVDMHFRIDMHPDITDEQAGLLLIALKDMAKENYLGGMGRNGHGRFLVKHINMQLNEETFNYENTHNDTELVFNGDMEELVSAGETSIVSMEHEELASFFGKLG